MKEFIYKIPAFLCFLIWMFTTNEIIFWCGIILMLFNIDNQLQKLVEASGE